MRGGGIDPWGFPPLLEPGFWPMTLPEIRERCLTPFPLSKPRAPITEGLEAFVGKLAALKMPGEMWLDGSYFTEWIDPRDSDGVYWIDDADIPTLNEEQNEFLDWIAARGAKAAHRCDCGFSVRYPEGHELYVQNEYWRAHWLAMFGFDRSGGTMKGVAILRW